MTAPRPRGSLPEPDPSIPLAPTALVLGRVVAAVLAILGVVTAYQAMMNGSAGGFVAGVLLLLAGLIVGRVAELALSRTPTP